MTQITNQQLVSLDAANPREGSLRSLESLLFGLTEAELTALMVQTGEPPWRGRQIVEAIYHQWVADVSEITTLPKALREMLSQKGWQVGRPSIAQTFQSVDGTERYLVQCGAETVETVWMPEGDDGESGDIAELDEQGKAAAYQADKPRAPSFCHPERAERVEGPASCNSGERVGNHEPKPTYESSSSEPQRATICVSSQVGCAVNCQFCLTAKLGLQRNLTAGEIAGQVVSVLARHNVEVGRDRLNLVFMGMGEPFLNYDNFMVAVRLLVTEVGLSPQRMTVSTSGIVPGIERFAEETSEIRPKLAISLNAPNDEVRSTIMPINRKWPIESVIDAVRKLRLRPRERVTFEYVLLGGITDRPEQAQEVARLVRRTGLPAKVNLIAWNPGPGIAYNMPSPESVEAFRLALRNAGIPAFIRKPRGRDIYAACGQLKRTVEG